MLVGGGGPIDSPLSPEDEEEEENGYFRCSFSGDCMWYVTGTLSDSVVWGGGGHSVVDLFPEPIT